MPSRDASPVGDFHALVIGVDEYEHWQALDCAVSSACEVANVLQRHYGFQDVILLTNEDASRSAILAALRQLQGQAADRDSVLIYYSGHGNKDRSSGYWIPSDGSNSPSSYVDHSDVADAVKPAAMPARHVLIVTDSCFHGGAPAAAPERITKRYLRSAMREQSRQCLTSGSTHPVAHAGLGTASVFTREFVRMLLNPPRKEFVPSALLSKLREAVTASAGGKAAEPEFSELQDAGHGAGGEFLFIRDPDRLRRKASASPASTPSGPSSGAEEQVRRIGSYFTVPSSSEDQFGNPVVSRDDRTNDPDTGLPYEIWVSDPAMEMLLVTPGEFLMGQDDGQSDERPAHRVRITKPFYFGKYVVTQKVWQAIMGSKPWTKREHQRDEERNPATYVDWNDCQTFITKLNERLGGGRFRMPTEAEWEHACRAGTTTEFWYGDERGELDAYAWYSENTKDIGEVWAHPVGAKIPSPWGFYDMHGNVWEWCQDYYGPYSKGTQVDPTGPTSGTTRVDRGGGFSYIAGNCRSPDRYGDSEDFLAKSLGVRLAISVE